MSTQHFFRFAFLIAIVSLPYGGANASVEQKDGSIKEVVDSNTTFAFDLFHQLAAENHGNLFFSPYSISSALAMIAEGACAETAIEMGKVLRFPPSARRREPSEQMNPWNLSLIHNSMASINRRLSGRSPRESQQIRKKVANLHKKHSALTDKLEALERSQRWKKYESMRKDLNKITEKLNSLLKQLDQYEIRIANALWAEETYAFKQSYIDTINTYYKTGGVFPVDFKSNYEAARQRVNRWVEDQTNQRIQNMIPTGEVNEYTRLILTNAIYFKGEWATPFEEESTMEEDFTLASGSKVKMPLMNAPSVKSVRYAAFNSDGSFFNTPQFIKFDQEIGLYPDKDGFAIVELPYQGDELSMMVIAPNKHDGISALERELTSENVDRWQNQLQKRSVDVFLPKFKLEADYKMKETLRTMGMVRAFEDPRKPKGAQFYGMTAKNDPMHQLYVTQVLQKAFVEVNEKGTEAAAATGLIEHVVMGLPPTVPFIPTFKADRPFVFLIRDRETGSILFIGRLSN